MNRYLLDTNHLSAYLDRRAPLEQKIDDALKAGDRIGLCLPVLCEYRAGIRLGRRISGTSPVFMRPWASCGCGRSTKRRLRSSPSCFGNYVPWAESCRNSTC